MWHTGLWQGTWTTGVSTPASHHGFNRTKRILCMRKISSLVSLRRIRLSKLLSADESWTGGAFRQIQRSCESTGMNSGSTGSYQRTNAKACPGLGIPKTSHSAHHKKHIAKVIAHCCVGYLLEGEVEAGGDGFLISCHRCASFKMPLRQIKI